MSIWEFGTIAMMWVFGFSILIALLRHKEKMAQTKVHESDVAEHFAQIEQRLTNLETLIIERDKHKAFDAAL